MIDFFGLKREKTGTNLLLDIGTETVKALLFERQGAKINLISSALEYFDRYGIFDSQDFEKDVFKKAISRTLQKLADKRNKSILLGLPADIFKARVVSQNLKRLKPKEIISEKEEREICQKILQDAKRDICHAFSQQSGILPADIQFINLKILEMKIDGYQVPVLRKYEGQNLDFRILATFLPSQYLERIKIIIESLDFRVKDLIQPAEYFGSDIAKRTYFFGGVSFKEKTDGIFLDIGGLMTQIFLVRNGILEKIDEFLVGSQLFSKAISERLGVRETEGRILKERYSKRELSQESSERIKEILSFPSQVWFKNLKQKINEMTAGYSLFSNIILFGGGSQLPEIKAVFKNNDREGSLLGKSPEVGFLTEQDKTVEGKKISNNPQEAPLLLMAYAWCSRLK